MKSGKSLSPPHANLRLCLEKIAREFDQATSESFTNHPLANFIRDDFTAAISDVVGFEKSVYKTKASPGMSKWADVPWGAIFHPLITKTAQSGFYIVYLISKGGSRIYLSLMQGGTEVRNEFKAKADYLKVLRFRSSILRNKLHEFSDRFPDMEINLDSEEARPEFYEAAHVLGKHYVTSEGLPSQLDLEKDLKMMCTVYKELIFRGGVDGECADDDSPDSGSGIIQRREYRLHKVIERTGNYSKKVKEYHGTVCQVCSFDFEKTYGAIGRNYIDAHHLVPLSELKEGIDYTYSVAKDFAVLCANCHRMIHKSDNPSDLETLRLSLRR
jgi:5-methylcytosine-specific restriction protein A